MQLTTIYVILLPPSFHQRRELLPLSQGSANPGASVLRQHRSSPQRSSSGRGAPTQHHQHHPYPPSCHSRHLRSDVNFVLLNLPWCPHGPDWKKYSRSTSLTVYTLAQKAIHHYQHKVLEWALQWMQRLTSVVQQSYCAQKKSITRIVVRTAKCTPML